MFIKSKMSIPAKYYKGSDCIILKPNTVTFIEDTRVTAKELKDCYGDRIDVIAGTDTIPTVEEPITDVKLENRKEDVTLDSINKILEEISNEEAEKDLTNVLEEISNGEAEKDLTNVLEENEAVINFLEGKTDELPEGTKEISNEEAEKLEKEVKKKEAKKKEASKKEIVKKQTKKNK